MSERYTVVFVDSSVRPAHDQQDMSVHVPSIGISPVPGGLLVSLSRKRRRTPCSIDLSFTSAETERERAKRKDDRQSHDELQLPRVAHGISRGDPGAR